MSVLGAIALQSGLPILAKILTRRLGDRNGKLATNVIEAVATRLGAAPEEIETLAAENPGRVIDAMREVERAAPELLEAYSLDAELQLATLAADRESAFAYSWRPGGMYLLGFLILWNAVLLHVANAVWKIALPPMPWDVLFGLVSVYAGFYMGGHTVKDVVAKWTGAKQ